MPAIFSRYYGILFKYRLLIVAVTLIAVLVAFIKTMRTPKMYAAGTLLELSYRAPSVVPTMNFGGSSYWNFDEFVNTQIMIIRSTEVARRAIDSLGLTNWSVGAVRGAISVSLVEGSRMVRIRAVGTNPETVAMLANGVGQAYMDLQFEKQVRQSRKVIQWLRGRMDEILADLRESQTQEYNFALEKRIVSLEGKRNVLIERLEQIEIAYSQARTERLKIEAKYRHLEGELKKGETGYYALESLLSSEPGEYIQGMRSRLAATELEISNSAHIYGPKHPKMKNLLVKYEEQKKQMKRSTEQFVENAKVKWQSAKAQENSMYAELQRLSDETLKFNETWMEYQGLQQDVQKNQQLYEILVQRLKEVDLTKNLQSETTQVMEPAVRPGAPFAPNVQLNMMVALVIGLGLGLGLALVFDYYDPRVRSSAEFTRLTKVPVLVEIPSVGASIEDPIEKTHYVSRIVINEPASPEAELFRVLRTHLLFGGDNRKPIRTVVVSGIHPKEGKSTVATNLALSLAQMERRVLLVDADIRRASLTHSFDMEDLSGLSEVLSGESDWQSMVQMTDVANLYLVPAGRMRENPGELLTSNQVTRLLRNWQSEFDHIIIDMAPILAVSDALTLAADVEGVILVVKPGTSSRNEAVATVERLVRIDAKILGAVFNQVDHPETPTSGYYYYYRQPVGETEI